MCPTMSRTRCSEGYEVVLGERGGVLGDDWEGIRACRRACRRGPGKCFADGAIPALVRPRQTAVTYFETSSGTLQIHDKQYVAPKCVYRRQRTVHLQGKCEMAR